MDALPARHASPAIIEWTILGLALLALGGVLGGNLYQEKANIEARERERLLYQTQIVQQILDVDLVALNAVLGDLGRDFVQGKTSRDFNHRLETLNEALTGVRTLVILDGAGLARAADPARLAGLDFSQREFFQTVLNNPSPDTLFISPPFQTEAGVYAINVSRMIQGPDGRFAGVVTAILDPDFFIPLLRSVLSSPDMRTAISHGDGLLFLLVPDSKGVVGRNLDQPGSMYRRHRDSGQSSNVFIGRSYSTGDERMLAVRTIRPTGLLTDKTMVVTVSRKYAEIFTDWRTQAVFTAGLFGLAVLVSGLGFFLFRKHQMKYEREMALAARRIEDNERFIRTVANSVPGLIAYWDESLRCVYANYAYLEWFGKTPEQMLGMPMRELLGEKLFTKNQPHIQGALRGEPQHFERTLVKPDGSAGYTLIQYIPDMHGGRVKGFFVLVADVSELKNTQVALEEKVRELDILATTDPLTGLGNRRHFLEHALEEFNRTSRFALDLVYLMMDIDHFKAINDTHGHDAGDEVLKSLAATVRETLRSTDLIGRLGGEEFAALLIHTDLAGARLLAERLRQALEDSEAQTKSGPIRFTVSIGLSVYAGPQDTVPEIMKRGDLALYQAKDTGRNQVRVFGEV